MSFVIESQPATILAGWNYESAIDGIVLCYSHITFRQLNQRISFAVSLIILLVKVLPNFTVRLTVRWAAHKEMFLNEKDAEGNIAAGSFDGNGRSHLPGPLCRPEPQRSGRT
ncbi:MAG: hypothetical protein H6661_00960 [Ardenticatenaceae bacterium]|nr:hypothetical protein [Ardenticatenaceae bacterium]